jgi:hypothetical protein
LRAVLKQFPVEAAERVELDTGIAGEATLREVCDMGPAVCGLAHLGKAVLGVAANVTVDRKLAGSDCECHKAALRPVVVHASGAVL